MYREFTLVDTIRDWIYVCPSIAVIFAVCVGLSKLAKYDSAMDETPRWGKIMSYVLGATSALYVAYLVFGDKIVYGGGLPGIIWRGYKTLILSIGFGYATYFSSILPSHVSIWTKCGKVVAHIFCWFGLATIPFRLIDGSLLMMTVANFIGYTLLPAIGLALGLYLYRGKKTLNTVGDQQGSTEGH